MFTGFGITMLLQLSLDDIESQYYNNHDIPWTIKDVKSFLDNNSMQN